MMFRTRQSVIQLSATKKSVGGCLQPTVSSETVLASVSSILHFVPGGDFECELGYEDRFKAAVPETGAHCYKRLIVWQDKILGRVISRREGAVVHRCAQQTVQRHFRVRIKQVIHADIGSAAMPVK